MKYAKTSSTKVVQYASTQWIILTSYFNLAHFALCHPCNVQILQSSFSTIIRHLYCPCFPSQWKDKMPDHVFQMSSSILCFPAKCTQEKELLTSHGMHMVKVCIDFLLKSQLYVVLQPRNSCRMCATSLATNLPMPISSECVTTSDPDKKTTSSVPHCH